MNSHNRHIAMMAIALAFFLGFSALSAHAHCDTLDGPVVADARVALEQGRIDPVIKWVRAHDEEALQQVFDHVVEVRALSDDARRLSDRYFLETLVRIHREGEGAPFTGLKPEGSQVNPGIAMADEAVASGDVDELADYLKQAVDQGLRQRFKKAHEQLADANASAEAGRAYVAAYVNFIHYVEGLVQAAKGGRVHDSVTVATAEHTSHDTEHAATSAGHH